MLFPRRFHHIVLGSCIAFGSLGLGWVPQFSPESKSLSWENQAIAQQPSSADINRYARAYLAIYGNNRMESLLLEVESLVGYKPSWEIRCDQTQSITRLNHTGAINSVNNYCNNVLPGVIDSIMPRRTFNRISNQLPGNPALQEDIKDAMLDILKTQ